MLFVRKLLKGIGVGAEVWHMKNYSSIINFLVDFEILPGDRTWAGLEPAPTSLHSRKIMD
jgi:hypothetical protein